MAVTKVVDLATFKTLARHSDRLCDSQRLLDLNNATLARVRELPVRGRFKYFHDKRVTSSGDWHNDVGQQLISNIDSINTESYIEFESLEEASSESGICAEFGMVCGYAMSKVYTDILEQFLDGALEVMEFPGFENYGTIKATVGDVLFFAEDYLADSAARYAEIIFKSFFCVGVDLWRCQAANDYYTEFSRLGGSLVLNKEQIDGLSKENLMMLGLFPIHLFLRSSLSKESACRNVCVHKSAKKAFETCHKFQRYISLGSKPGQRTFAVRAMADLAATGVHGIVNAKLSDAEISMIILVLEATRNGRLIKHVSPGLACALIWTRTATLQGQNSFLDHLLKLDKRSSCKCERWHNAVVSWDGEQATLGDFADLGFVSVSANGGTVCDFMGNQLRIVKSGMYSLSLGCAQPSSPHSPLRAVGRVRREHLDMLLE